MSMQQDLKARMDKLAEVAAANAVKEEALRIREGMLAQKKRDIIAIVDKQDNVSQLFQQHLAEKDQTKSDIDHALEEIREESNNLEAQLLSVKSVATSAHGAVARMMNEREELLKGAKTLVKKAYQHLQEAKSATKELRACSAHQSKISREVNEVLQDVLERFGQLQLTSHERRSLEADKQAVDTLQIRVQEEASTLKGAISENHSFVTDLESKLSGEAGLYQRLRDAVDDICSYEKHLSEMYQSIDRLADMSSQQASGPLTDIQTKLSSILVSLKSQSSKRTRFLSPEAVPTGKRARYQNTAAALGNDDENNDDASVPGSDIPHRRMLGIGGSSSSTGGLLGSSQPAPSQPTRPTTGEMSLRSSQQMIDDRSEVPEAGTSAGTSSFRRRTATKPGARVDPEDLSEAMRQLLSRIVLPDDLTIPELEQLASWLKDHEMDSATRTRPETVLDRCATKPILRITNFPRCVANEFDKGGSKWDDDTTVRCNQCDRKDRPCLHVSLVSETEGKRWKLHKR